MKVLGIKLPRRSTRILSGIYATIATFGRHLGVPILETESNFPNYLLDVTFAWYRKARGNVYSLQLDFAAVPRNAIFGMRSDREFSGDGDHHVGAQQH
jgi:hypothetical protein